MGWYMFCWTLAVVGGGGGGVLASWSNEGGMMDWFDDDRAGAESDCGGRTGAGGGVGCDIETWLGENIGGIPEAGAVGNICGLAAYCGREERLPPLRAYGLLTFTGFDCEGWGGTIPSAAALLTTGCGITGNDADWEIDTGDPGAVDCGTNSIGSWWPLFPTVLEAGCVLELEVSPTPANGSANHLKRQWLLYVYS